MRTRWLMSGEKRSTSFAPLTVLVGSLFVSTLAIVLACEEYPRWNHRTYRARAKRGSRAMANR